LLVTLTGEPFALKVTVKDAGVLPRLAVGELLEIVRDCGPATEIEPNAEAVN
jgi:hypothetical protein